MEGGNKKKVNRLTPSKKKSLLPPPFITNGGILEIELSSIQKSILKQLKDLGRNFTLKGCARLLHCDHKNIEYHLKKLREYNLVEKNGNFSIWKITNEGLQLLSRGGIKRLTPSPKRLRGKVNYSTSRTPNLLELTKVEKEVLELYQKEGLGLKEIANRRNCSIPNISKTLTRAKKKFNLRGGINEVNYGGSDLLTSSPSVIRLHREQFRIEIIHKSSFYEDIRASNKNKIMCDGNTVKLWPNVIEVYSNKDFTAQDPNTCTEKALEYWNTIFQEIEQRAKVEIIREGFNNISRVKCEYERTNDEYAKECEEEGHKVRIYTQDGKLRALVDYSNGTPNFETVGAETARPDMNVYTRRIKDVLEHGEVLLDPSQLQSFVGTMARNVETLQKQVYEIGASQKNSIEMFNNLVMALTPNTPPTIRKDDNDKGGLDAFNSSMFM